MADWITLNDLPCGSLAETENGIVFFKTAEKATETAHEGHLIVGQWECYYVADGKRVRFDKGDQTLCRSYPLTEEAAFKVAMRRFIKLIQTRDVLRKCQGPLGMNEDFDPVTLMEDLEDFITNEVSGGPVDKCPKCDQPWWSVQIRCDCDHQVGPKPSPKGFEQHPRNLLKFDHSC